MTTENEKPFFNITFSLIVIHFIWLIPTFFSYLWSPDDGVALLEFYLREDPSGPVQFFVVMIGICISTIALYFSKYKFALVTILLPMVTLLVIGVSGFKVSF